ncbi:MAG: DUF2652 domain-containing protein [Saprospiraceae bacterium]
MSETNTTILIPDISGFTEFMTTTELYHSTKAINMLIDAIITAVGDEYEVSEIEGDAVLLIRKGPAPSQKEVQDICLRIFNAFHFRRGWMEQYTVCPCGACQSLFNLTLKFVVHHGPLAEIKVGRFIKQSGPEMIVAHRLLKNSIGNNEYLLLTEKLLKDDTGHSETTDMQWSSSSEEYTSIGKIDYRFTLLNEARKNVPQPPAPKRDYKTDDTPYYELKIAANIMDVYMAIMNIPERHTWFESLKSVEQEMNEVFLGSTHHCIFEQFVSIVSPLSMRTSDKKIVYAEQCSIQELNLSLVHEFVFKKIDPNHTSFSTRLLNAGESAIPIEIFEKMTNQMKEMADQLKVYSEAARQ